jgi:hypothetical protein
MMRHAITTAVLVLLGAVPASAQTRFYFPATTAAPITTAAHAEWEQTGNAVSRLLVTTKLGEALANQQITHTTTNAEDTLFRQYIKCGLDAQTISGTVKGQILATENSALANAYLGLAVRVVSSDGMSVTGVLRTPDTTIPNSGGNEFATSATNRSFREVVGNLTTITVTSVNPNAGDCLVIEIGTRDNSTTTDNATLRFGDSSASDLPENETATSDFNPWIEFSDTITFTGQSAGPPVGTLNLLGVGR